ncbi:hypothetical protein M9434_000020 [Picochlorum sp. BPE23]|nr:hypothetical protein M9434_000020 [Picochlorum sp. BPE23]
MAYGADPSVGSGRGTGGLATLMSRHGRNMIAFHLLMGRRVQSLASELVRRLLDCVAWLNKPLSLVGPRVKLGVALKHWHAVMGLFLGGVSVHFMVRMYLDSKSGRRGRRRLLQQKMMEAETYEDWKRCASALEKVDEKRIAAVEKLQNQLYDIDLIQGRVEYLRRIRERGDPYELMFVVRADLIRNMGNIADASLHCRLSSVPRPIQEYILQVKYCLRDISSAASVPVEERLAFLRETRHAFGRTALVLSGGGSFGSFHLGVIKALLDGSLLPRVLSGSSAGAIVVALVGTRTRSELKELFSSLDETLKGIDFYSYNTAVQIASHLLLKGTLQDYRVLQDRLQKLLGEYTFEEAYARSGIALNVAVSAADTTEPPRLLNYLTAPNVLVWSAVACSSAFPFLFAPQTLLARDSKGRVAPFANKSAGESQRRWRDGSLEEDLPMRGLSEMFNVNYFLVSQCNPYLLPIIAAKESVPRTIGVLIEQEFKHRCQQLMELMPRKLGASKLLKLLSQPWEGDVTMVLPVTTLSTLKSVINLSKDDVMLAKWEGQRATWRKLAAIATNCDIEVTLDECLRQVTAKARRKKAKQAGLKPDSNPDKNGKRIHNIPSWLHLQSLGIPHADSFEKLGMMQSQIDLAVSRARSQASSSGIHLSDIMTSSVPDRLDEYDLEDDTEAYPTFEDAVPGLPENRKPDKDTWKNLFQVAPTTMSSYAIDLIAP